MSIKVTDVPPKPAFRRFELVRTEDVSGVSGTGVVALGVQFPDGTVVVRWNTGVQPASTVNHIDIDAVVAIHGHDGRTTVEWLDDEEGLNDSALMLHEVIGSAISNHSKKILREVRDLADELTHSSGKEEIGEEFLAILDQPFPDGEN